MISRLLRPSAILRSTYSRVTLSVRIRVNAMVLIARFSRRSPPRLSRCLTVFPEDAGIGQVPAIIAKAAAERMRPGCDQTVITIAAVTAPTPCMASSSGTCWVVSLVSWTHSV